MKKMDNEGYPEESELELIRNWDYMDVFNLMSFIKERWNFGDWGFVQKWGKDKVFKTPVLYWELHTGGWSGNESIIGALLENRFFKIIYYKAWITGGHYYFEISPKSLGYLKTSEYCKEKNITRQYINKIKNQFDWIVVTDNKQYLKPKTIKPHPTSKTNCVKLSPKTSINTGDIL